MKNSCGSMIQLPLLLLLAASSVAGNNATLTAREERILDDVYQVVVQDFRYRRHEWSFAAVKFAGFLRFFGSSWRLVARLGGTYRVGGSSYYNRWNWNDALATSVGYLDDLERYHRIYRHLSGDSAGLLSEWHRRFPQHSQEAALFVGFMASHSNGLLGVPGYLAAGPQQEARYRQLRALTDLANVGDGDGACQMVGSATRRLLDLARWTVGATGAGTDAILYTMSEPDPALLAAIATNYTELSVLAWDRLPALVANASSDPRCHGNASGSNSAAWLARQVLGHVLLHLQRVRTSRLRLNPAQSAALTALHCRVVREDLDKELENHLEARELIQLDQLLDTCRNRPDVPGGTAYTELESLWQMLRTRISREYSAFQQYSNRIPAITSAKTAVKLVLPIIAVFGVGLNALIALYYARHVRARRIGRNFLIALLACFDTAVLLTSCLVLFTDRYMEHDQELKPSSATDLWCKFQAYLLNLAVESSAFVVVILSVERFLAVYSLFRRHSTSPEQAQHKELPLRKLSIMALCAFCFACIFNCMLIIGDEVAAPAKSTIGRQCVHYVRLGNFHANLAFVTRVKPVLNALVRSLLPYSLVCLLSLATCWLLFKKGAYQSLHRQELEAGTGAPDGQLARSLGQLGLAFAYLLLTAPTPVVYTLFMTAHADRLIIKLNNGLYDEVDPLFRAHWSRIGRLTVAQYVTEYVLVPLSASVNFCVFCLTDRAFRRFVAAGLTCRWLRGPSWSPAQEELADSREPERSGGGGSPHRQIVDDWEQTEIT